MSITIRDVAKLAGVSVSTASLALNDRDYVSPETKAKVLEAAKKLGYIPSVIARRFATGKTNTIGLIAFISHEHPLGGFYMPLILGVIDTVGKANYSFQLDIKGEDKEGVLNKKEILVRIAKQKMLDGLLILSHWLLHFEDISGLLELSFPFVILNGDIPEHRVNCVEIDNFAGACKAVEYLISLGHKRIGHISGPVDQKEAQDRLMGYIETLHHHQIPLDEELICYGDFHKKSGYEGMKKLLSLSSPPTAVFVANDNMCLGAMEAVKEEGLSVPKDISLTGFDDIEAAAHMSSPLTTVRQPRYTLGQKAAELLLEVLKDTNAQEPKRIVLDTELVIRDSCRSCSQQKR